MAGAGYDLEEQKKQDKKKCKCIMCSLMGALVLVAVIAVGVTYSQTEDVSEKAAINFLEHYNKLAGEVTNNGTIASWNYESNITDYNQKLQLEETAKGAKFARDIWEQVQKFPWQGYKDESVRRQFMQLAFLGSAALSPEKFEELEKIKQAMQSTYAKATICDFTDKTKCNLHLEPEITKIISNSRNPEELKHVWVSWRNETGRKYRKEYTKYVDLLNEAAKINNLTDAAQMWLRNYESDDFPHQVEALWQDLQPLYQQLHAYVRRRLYEHYGSKIMSKTGPIPAHLLGNMWSQTWDNIADLAQPFPNKPALNITPALIEQGYTPLKIFQLAEEFFTSINLTAMPEKFWKNSILEKPQDGRELVCHASAWDFYDGEDFRIKQCTVVTQDQLETAHHEMGHIQYFLQYKHQPIVFRDGANSGFHEAVGDTISLSAGTPAHLHKLKLLPEIPDDYEAEINQLFHVALNKITFLPFGYLMDQYRWSIFRGETSKDDYNCKWWQLREKYQGLEPPVDRSEEDFDAGSKYHIAGSVPYIRYFVSFVIQFQFHQALCEAAGQFDPSQPDQNLLHQCDIHGSLEAGKLLGNMLQMGGSKPWPDAMEAITKQRKMDAGPLLHYFRPLLNWLQNENKRTGEKIGWEHTKKVRTAGRCATIDYIISGRRKSVGDLRPAHKPPDAIAPCNRNLSQITFVMEEGVVAHSGGAGMNAAFVLVLVAFYLQVYDSNWFQGLQAAATSMFRPPHRLEVELEDSILGANWTRL